MEVINQDSKIKIFFGMLKELILRIMLRLLYSNVMMFVDMQTCFAKLNKFKTYMQVIGIKNLEVRIEAFETELGCGVYTNSFASLCITYDVTTMTKAYEAPKVKRETQKHDYLVELSDC
jgi:hypothetical protein